MHQNRMYTEMKNAVKYRRFEMEDIYKTFTYVEQCEWRLNIITLKWYHCATFNSISSLNNKKRNIYIYIYRPKCCSNQKHIHTFRYSGILLIIIWFPFHFHVMKPFGDVIDSHCTAILLYRHTHNKDAIWQQSQSH